MLGPPLWNVFYEDTRKALEEECVYANDFNLCKMFPADTDNKAILKNLQECQKEFHNWGRANQVVFDPGKEDFQFVSASETHGGEFILRIIFDASLVMQTNTTTYICFCRLWVVMGPCFRQKAV